MVVLTIFAHQRVYLRCGFWQQTTAIMIYNATHRSNANFDERNFRVVNCCEVLSQSHRNPRKLRVLCALHSSARTVASSHRTPIGNVIIARYSTEINSFSIINYGIEIRQTTAIIAFLVFVCVAAPTNAILGHSPAYCAVAAILFGGLCGCVPQCQYPTYLGFISCCRAIVLRGPRAKNITHIQPSYIFAYISNRIVVIRYNFLIFMDSDYLCWRFAILLDAMEHGTKSWQICARKSAHQPTRFIINMHGIDHISTQAPLFYCCIVYIYKH